MYSNLARYKERDEVARRLLRTGLAPTATYTNFIGNRLIAGDPAEAESTLAELVRKVPDFAAAPQYRSNIAFARRDWVQAEAEARKLLSGAAAFRQFAQFRLAALSGIRGQLAQAERLAAEGQRLAAERSGTPEEEVRLNADRARFERDLWLPDQDRKALALRLEALWRRNQDLRGERPVTAQGYPDAIADFARLERPDRARALLEEYRGKLTPQDLEDPTVRFFNEVAEGDVLVAEGKPRDAVRIFREACEPFRNSSAICDADPTFAEAYDLAGETDSALAYYDRFLALEANRQVDERVWYPRSLRRAGQIHERKGNREKALEYYGKFVDLWKDADPVLQPLVRETRQWIAQLTRERAP
jgi:tetratricopeptide (TPR) repeat protein